MFYVYCLVEELQLEWSKAAGSADIAIHGMNFESRQGAYY